MKFTIRVRGMRTDFEKKGGWPAAGRSAVFFHDARIVTSTPASRRDSSGYAGGAESAESGSLFPMFLYPKLPLLPDLDHHSSQADALYEAQQEKRGQ